LTGISGKGLDQHQMPATVLEINLLVQTA